MEHRDRIEKDVRDSAYHIIDYKGATSFGVGMALVRITGAVLRSQHSVSTVSTLLNGEFGLTDVCLSVPCIVTKSGVERVVESELTAREHDKLASSATALKKAMEELGNAE